MEKYGNNDLEKLLEKLKTFASKQTRPGLSPELRELVGFLKSQRLRHRNDAHAFCSTIGNGMRVLQDLLKDCEGASDSRDLVLVLGTIGNLCALESEPRKMIDTDTIKTITGYLETYSSPEVMSTVIRVVANLALDNAHIQILHGMGVVNKLSQLLSQPDVDLTCKKSITRALRILCLSQDCRDELKWSKGAEALVDALRSTNDDLASSAVQAIEVVSVDSDILRILSSEEPMQRIVGFCSHKKPKVRSGALGVALNAVKTLDSRMALTSAGGIEALVTLMDQHLADNGNSATVRRIVGGLCICCRDVNSRQRLRDCGGLKKLMSMLADPSHSCLHSSIMSALVAFYFDEVTLKQMVTRMGLLRTLNYHLREMVKVVGNGVEGVARSESDSAGEELMEVSGLSSAEGKDGDLERRDSVMMKDSSLDITSSTPPKRDLGKRLQLDGSANNQEVSGEDSVSDFPDTAAPPSTKRSRLEASAVEANGMTTPTTLLDSLLSSPSPFKASCSSPSQSESDLGEFQTRLEGQVVMMVSRISHLRDCIQTLSYPDTLEALMNYFACQTASPNEYIFRVLNRILSNPHCFQNCITTLVPSRILGYLRKLLPSSDAIDSASGVRRFRSMCLDLLADIAKNADSPYGQGVLEHLILTGGEEDKFSSCLAASTLSRSPRFCYRLMLDCGAYPILVGVATQNEHSHHQQALDALLALGHNMIRRETSGRLRQCHAHYRMPFTHLRRYPFLNSSFRGLSLSNSDSCLRDSSDGDLSMCSSHHYCRYMDSDQRPFDLTLLVHTPLGDKLQLQVHKSILAEESDVFKVMLSGHYKESSSGEVAIHSVPICGVVSMIHYLYGCSWKCPHIQSKLSKETLQRGVSPGDPSSSSDVIYAATQQLLDVITSSCDSDQNGRELDQCLQTMVCAGRFLLPDLIMQCEHGADRYITPGNVVAMFNFSLLHQCFCLGESCLRFLLNLPHSQLRTDTFGQLLSSPEAESALIILRLFLTMAES